MSERVDQWVKEALALSPKEQADLLDALAIAQSREESGLPVDEAWINDIVRRMESDPSTK